MKLLTYILATATAAAVLNASNDTNQTYEEPPISAKTIKFIDGIGKDVKTFLHDNKLIESNTSKGNKQ